MCFFCTDNDDYGIRWGNTAQALAWWWLLGVLYKATNTHHWVMCFVSYPLGSMVVKIAKELLTF
jgi:hypothetical protein